MCDFGFAVLLRAADGTMGTTNAFCGTKYYVAPEMLLDDRVYDNSVDWWSLGIIIFELLTGRPPFFSTNKERQHEKIINNEVAFSREELALLSPAAVAFIKQLLNKVCPTHFTASPPSNNCLFSRSRPGDLAIEPADGRC